MIRPKTSKPTPAEERRAYQIATERDGGRCVFMAWDCDTAVQRDHRQNRMPGNTVASNLQMLCLTHHIWKTEHPEEAIREGWAVPRHTLLTPAEWPARRYLPTTWGTLRLGWVLYDDAGGWEEIAEQDARKRMEGTN